MFTVVKLTETILETYGHLQLFMLMMIIKHSAELITKWPNWEKLKVCRRLCKSSPKIYTLVDDVKGIVYKALLTLEFYNCRFSNITQHTVYARIGYICCYG